MVLIWSSTNLFKDGIFLLGFGLVLHFQPVIQEHCIESNPYNPASLQQKAWSAGADC